MKVLTYRRTEEKKDFIDCDNTSGAILVKTGSVRPTLSTRFVFLF